MEDSSDKQWAKAYILDPLTAPEPSQDTGVAASHSLAKQLNRVSLSDTKKSRPSRKPVPIRHSSTKMSRPPSSSSRGYPTPPSSASPSQASFHPSNPFSTQSSSDPISPPGSPPGAAKPSRRYPPSASGNRASRASSARDPPDPDSTRSESQHHRSFSMGDCGVSRQRSIKERYPGDMSHRPLDTLKKEARAADRAPHLRRKNIAPVDTIDALDTIGGAYHHGGPFDAALASRNRNKLYSPLDAVRDSNMEAIRATPREYVQDTLSRRIPLQGTSAVPSGAQDFSGNIMDYQEGADLMREPDAAGGAYKRWDGIQYHPDDLKGKGEPSYTFERDLKKKARRNGESVEYEMESRPFNSRPPLSRHGRSQSDYSASQSRAATNSADLRRNHSTSKKLSDGIRRRFGSIRRRVEEVQ